MKSKYHGVDYCKNRAKTKPWRSSIYVNCKRTQYSYHETEIEAALAYNEKKIKRFGEGALNLNIIKL